MAWDVNHPAGNDEAKTLDEQIRGDKITLLAALGEEHVFTGDDQSGYHKQGAAVLIRDVEANLALSEAREGRLFWATDTQRLYIGDDSEPSEWVRVLGNQCARSSYNQVGADGPELSQTNWTALEYPAPISFATVGDATDLEITARLTLRVDTDDTAIYLHLYLDTVAVSAAVNGLGVVSHQNSPGAFENYVTLTLTWLATDVAAGAHTIDIRYKMGAAGHAHLCQDFNALLTVREA